VSYGFSGVPFGLAVVCSGIGQPEMRFSDGKKRGQIVVKVWWFVVLSWLVFRSTFVIASGYKPVAKFGAMRLQDD
jgi:hypothetical protein